MMASHVMVVEGLKNKHMDFPYGLFICFGVTRNISKVPFRYSCTGLILTLSSPMNILKLGIDKGKF